MKSLLKYPAEIIVVVCLLFVMGFRMQDNAWERQITSDGKGYYAYLPAVFIYHDFSFSFTAKMEKLYDPPDGSRSHHYLNTIDGKTVNKFYCGLAVLWVPFFFIAHLLAFILGFPADGYSLPYQFSIQLAALFYLWTGMKALAATLKLMGFAAKYISLTLVLVVLGTNLLYYAMIDVSHSHVYNFALISLFVFFLFRYFSTLKNMNLYMSAALYGLIFIARPSNGIIILLLPFVAGNMKRIRSLLSVKNIFFSTIIFIPILAIPSALWYLQAGKWYIYSYGEETFHFLNPHILDNLFSYKKGLFTYTPLAFAGLIGLIPFYKNERFRFYSLLFFLMFLVYVISSWWCWWYGCGVGQRAYTDYYCILGIMLCSLLGASDKMKVMQTIPIVLLLLLIPLNVLRLYQHKNGIFPCDSADRKFFWSHFFTWRQTRETDAIENDTIHYQKLKTLTLKNNSEKISELNEGHPYSSAIIQGIPVTESDSLCLISVQAKVFSKVTLKDSRLVISYENEKGSFHYSSMFLNELVPQEKWTLINFHEKMIPAQGKTDSLKIYFWNGNTAEQCKISELRAEILKAQ